jgi:hypothetical protein
MRAYVRLCVRACVQANVLVNDQVQIHFTFQGQSQAPTLNTYYSVMVAIIRQ